MPWVTWCGVGRGGSGVGYSYGMVRVLVGVLVPQRSGVSFVIQVSG
jgi:hypothetical protein